MAIESRRRRPRFYWWLAFGVLEGAIASCLCDEVAFSADSYDVVEDLPEWVPDSGKVGVDGDEVRLRYRDANAAEFEVVWKLRE